MESLSINKLSEKYDLGKETLSDILKALIAPGRELYFVSPQPLCFHQSNA
ncbi:hypothetical protein PT111_09085 [Erysipelothrix rhusiopathiae]|nr:hypothetical protein [Erysipelothrix rhusiopathiae]